jgi:hypothetical protein
MKLGKIDVNWIVAAIGVAVIAFFGSFIVFRVPVARWYLRRGIELFGDSARTRATYTPRNIGLGGSGGVMVGVILIVVAIVVPESSMTVHVPW